VAATLPYSVDELQEKGFLREQMPKHIAIIMDGNGRWAQSQGLPRIEGHRRGVTSVRKVVEESSRLGIEQLTLYCLSSENWKRPPEELSMLLSLLKQFVIEERSEIMRQGLRFCIIGRREGLGDDVLEEIDKTIKFAKDNTGMRLCLALNYGSRMEITDAVRAMLKKAANGEISATDVTEEMISDHLYTAGMSDPDLVIRTAGEMRVSNYLLWQISYAELWVTQKCWPEFREPELHQAMHDFSCRDRRFGGLNES